MVERGPYVSYANCGLPYYVGGVIPRESSLLVATEQTFRTQFAIDVRTHCEAVRISPKDKTVDLKNTLTGEVTTEKYDKLVLSPGAAPIRPPMPGIDLPGVFKVRTVPDVKEIKEWLEGHDPYSSGMYTYTGFQTMVPAKRAIVVGGGFIGLEMAENLKHLGLDVTLLQRGPQVMDPLDPEMALYVKRYMEKNGVNIVVNAEVTGFEQAANGSLKVLTQSGETYPGEIVVLGDRRAAGDVAGERGRSGNWRTRRYPRRRSDAHQRSGYLRRRRCDRGQGLHHGSVGAYPVGRASQSAGAHCRRSDRRARLAFPGHAGHIDHRVVRRRGGLHRRQRKNAEAAGRYRLRKGLPLSEFARGLLSGREVSGDESHLPQIGWQIDWGAGRGAGWRGQAHRCVCDGDSVGRDDLRSGRSPNCVTRRSLAAPKRPSILRAWWRAMCCAAICR